MSALPQGNNGPGLVEIDLTVNAVSGFSSWVDIPAVSPSLLGFGVEVVAGGPTYTVQHQFGSGPVFDHPYVAAQTVNMDGNYFAPVSRIRIYSTTGQVKLWALIPGLISKSIVEVV